LSQLLQLPIQTHQLQELLLLRWLLLPTLQKQLLLLVQLRLPPKGW
jgi:hypothetical protein